MLETSGLLSAMNHTAASSPALLSLAMLEQSTPALGFFNSTFKLELLVVALLIAFFVVVRVTLSVEAPGPAQQVREMLHGFVGGQAEQVIGHGYERFQAFVTCIFLFVLGNNLLGLIPGVETPTSVPVVPLGIATL